MSMVMQGLSSGRRVAIQCGEGCLRTRVVLPWSMCPAVRIRWRWQALYRPRAGPGRRPYNRPRPVFSPRTALPCREQFINPPELNPAREFTHVGDLATGQQGRCTCPGRSASIPGAVVGRGDFQAPGGADIREPAGRPRRRRGDVRGRGEGDDVRGGAGRSTWRSSARFEAATSTRQPPASTLVGVAAAVPDWLVEIEVIAVVPA